MGGVTSATVAGDSRIGVADAGRSVGAIHEGDYHLNKASFLP